MMENLVFNPLFFYTIILCDYSIFIFVSFI